MLADVRRAATFVLLVMFASCGTAGGQSHQGRRGAAPATKAQAIQRFSHVVVVVMENREFGDVIGNPDAPYINALATTYSLVPRFHAIRHPSLPNYLAMLGGS